MGISLGKIASSITKKVAVHTKQTNNAKKAETTKSKSASVEEKGDQVIISVKSDKSVETSSDPSSLKSEYFKVTERFNLHFGKLLR